MIHKAPHNIERLGLDFGRVINAEPTDGLGPTMFMDDFLETPPSEGCFEVVAEQQETRFGDEIYIVSKCGPKMQEKTKLWLEHWRFFEETGTDPNKIYFCREYAEKGTIANQLGLTHFVDDRLNVLALISPKVQRILFVPDSERTVPRPEAVPQGIVIALGWTGVSRLLKS